MLHEEVAAAMVVLVSSTKQAAVLVCDGAADGADGGGGGARVLTPCKQAEREERGGAETHGAVFHPNAVNGGLARGCGGLALAWGGYFHWGVRWCSEGEIGVTRADGASLVRARHDRLGTTRIHMTPVAVHDISALRWGHTRRPACHAVKRHVAKCERLGPLDSAGRVSPVTRSRPRGRLRVQRTRITHTPPGHQIMPALHAPHMRSVHSDRTSQEDMEACPTGSSP